MNSYEEFAVAYARHTAANPYNTRYERPTMHAELGDIHGKTVLDAACASGEHTKLLFEAGAARVIAVDASPALVDIARSRFDDRVQAVCADLTANVGSPLFASCPVCSSRADYCCSRRTIPP